MESLIGKNTGDLLTAAEWNQLPSEVQNIIEDSGQVLSSGNLRQLAFATSTVVATKAQALAITPVDGRKIFITSDDGGPFIMKTGAAVGTYNDDGGAFTGTKFTSGDGSSGVSRYYSGAINVRWFGAKGDDVTDDTAAIIAAKDSLSAGTVFFPEGKYVISAVIPLKAHVNMMGEAPANFPQFKDSVHTGTSVIRLASGADCRFFEATNAQAVAQGLEVETNGNYYWHIAISNLAFDGYGTLQTVDSNGIYLQDAWSINILNCSFQHQKGVMIYLDDCNEVEIKDCQGISAFTDETITWVVLKDCADCKVQQSSFFGSEDPVIVLDGSTYNLIQGNLLGNTLATGAGPYGKKSGIYVNATSTGNNILGNRCDQNYENGIELDGDGNVVVGNTALASGFNNAAASIAGILVNSDGNTITGNRCQDYSPGNQDYGIRLIGAADFNVISGNEIRSNQVLGLSNESSGANNQFDGIGSEIQINTLQMQVRVGTPVIGPIGGTLFQGWLMDGAAAERIQGYFVPPDGWQKCRFELTWVNAGAGAGDVDIYIETHSFEDGADISTAVSELHGVLNITALAQNIVETTSPIEFTIVPGRTYSLNIARDGAADTLANDIGVLGLKAIRTL